MRLESSRTSSLFLLLIGILIVVTGCNSEEKSDAYGQFEAIETTISTEIGGKLLAYNVAEGDRLEKDQTVGLVDTTRLILQKKELEAKVESIRSQIVNINAEVEVRQEELTLAGMNLKRTQAMREDKAATAQQLDNVRSKVETIRKQISALQTQKQSIRAEISATQARIEQVQDQLQDTRIINPVAGTVLTSYVEPYELVQQGQPLYQIASLDTLELKVYVSGAQLPSIKIGQAVQVLVDSTAERNQQLSGRVSWIASEAEFTPKMIQTKEERVTQVYAMKVRVPNPNGVLKIGMPGEVNFRAEN
ncbi:HlyD family secretion protein [Fodinibius salsisoli]|uniref:HlyD family efflux transporter periplasmic adaptor subunit n=1 Tax=Fodinibius salsisoli TaxID=2820877 RepID=A0ABT3PPG2_9BACT|nr:HlyD family efflux transporter periplasmic adaptor subunit [Fodinibius salsisoli]MCW9707735.1 HlyD family efflux transporter periplasmic adaptor subunit [Fodinibius salsisoli]